MKSTKKMLFTGIIACLAVLLLDVSVAAAEYAEEPCGLLEIQQPEAGISENLGMPEIGTSWVYYNFEFFNPYYFDMAEDGEIIFPLSLGTMRGGLNVPMVDPNFPGRHRIWGVMSFEITYCGIQLIPLRASGQLIAFDWVQEVYDGNRFVNPLVRATFNGRNVTLHSSVEAFYRPLQRHLDRFGTSTMTVGSGGF